MGEPERLAVLISFSGAGGVERMVLNLIEGLVGRGMTVDLLAIRAESAHLEHLPPGVRLHDLGVRHSGLAIAPLAAWLRRHQPVALLAAKDRAIRAAILARRLAGWHGTLVGRLGTNLSTAIEDHSRARQWLRTAPMRLLYRDIDRIVAVSEGVAEDTRRITGLPAERIGVVRNPVVTSRLFDLAAAPCPHPWLAQSEVPTLLGVGRLTKQKDFATLLDAFSKLVAQRPAYLVVLGEGRLRGSLEAQAERLNIASRVALPGFVTNPYAWVSRASLFVLSSAWEGSPNVLTEALALGVPAVATDCPSGPRELLDDGRYGKLVEVGDADGLAAAISATLANPLPCETLRGAVSEYSVDTATNGYLRALGLLKRG
jgi:glycosyltransferase involved in cell wall biosynthesis